MSSNLKVNNILPSTGDTVAVSGIASVTSSVSIASSCTATTFYGSGANLTGLAGGGTGLDLNDNVKLRLGTGNDLEIYHSGTVSFIDDLTGGSDGVSLRGKNVRLQSNANIGAKSALNCIANGAVELYHNNVKRFETDSTGVRVVAPEGARAELRIIGDEGDDNNDYFKLSAGEGTLKLQDASNGSTWEDNIVINAAGSVELYHDNSKKFETDSSGTTTTGRVYITGTILQGTTDSGEANGDEATFANTGGNAGITIRSAVNAETKIYFSEGTSGGSQYRGTINYNHNTNYMAFSANEYERMRITSDGTLQLYYYNQNNGRGRINFGSSAPAFIEGYDTGNAGSGAYLKFGTNNTERSRIDNSGHFFFSGMTSLTASGSNKGVNFENSTNNGRINIHANSSAGNALGVSFYNNGNNVGTIYYNTSGTSYNTSSDYRLKENEVPISDGITRLKTLKPYRFNFKSDPTKTVDGFFAHEVTAVPEAIQGEKDAEEMQQIDQSKLVPLLTAALQEAIAEIETLKTKVAALEGS